MRVETLTGGGSMGASVLPWAAVHVRPNAERAVARLLHEKGVVVFAPAYTERRRWSDRVVERQFPLFPGYIFSRFDLSKRFPILSTEGVLKILSTGAEVARVEEEEVSAVRRLVEGASGFLPHPLLRPGRKVRVRSGPLAGLEGSLVKFKGGHRLIVSITLLQRAVAAEIDATDVQPI